MTFLAPLFLFGAAAIALPILFHLIRRTTRERTPFSSLMFLQPSPPRLTHRSRLENLLLLLLRCAVLCLLALAFARPFINKAINNDPASGTGRRIALLLDTSASMRRADLWTAARDKAQSILRGTTPADQVAVFTFDRQLNQLVSFDQWNATPAGQRASLVTGRLGDTSPGWSGTHLGNAVISAAEALADSAAKPQKTSREIILITDFQEGSRLDQLQGFEWPKGITLTVESLKARHPNNAGLQLVTDLGDADPKSAGNVRVRVTNAADSKREQFKVGWAQPDGRSFFGRPTDVYVPAGQSRILSLPPDTNSLTRIILQGDDEDFDNSVFVTPFESSRLTVSYLGSDSPEDTKKPLYFLQRAFQETRRQTVQVVAQQPNLPIPPDQKGGPALFVVTESLGEAPARELHAQLQTGKTVLVALKNEAASAMLAQLLGLEHMSLAEVHPTSYAMLAEIDFRHPLFAPFADPRFSDFTKIHFWQYRRVDPASISGSHVLAKFDSGDPALLEAPVGKGRLFILTSGWQPEDSQLALSTKFVPLLYSLLDQTGAAPPLPIQYQVGDALPLLLPAESLTTPDGSTVSLAKDATNFSSTLTPGIYRIGSPPQLFAVNLDPAESRTAPLPSDELERLGAPRSNPTTSRTSESASKVRLKYDELESRQKLWRWIILATLAILIFESWLAGYTARHFSKTLPQTLP
jgi:hypothetical protein